MTNKKSQSLTEDQVRHIAHLAKLTLSEEEVEKYKDQLSSVLGYIDSLNEVDTKTVKPTDHVTNLENIFREDEVIPSLPQKAVLANAPRTYKGFFQVDAIFE